MIDLTDGDAVFACRHALATETFPEMQNWRNTVVTEQGPDGPRYVVRIWRHTPVQDSRPSGTPDRVYVVEPHPGPHAGMSVEQVHPTP